MQMLVEPAAWPIEAVRRALQEAVGVALTIADRQAEAAG
jgi:hypothetical protein